MRDRARGYAHRVDIVAGADEVWRALTEPEHLPKWCSPGAQIRAHPEVEIRWNAALALGGVGGPEAKPAVPVLLGLLRKDDNNGKDKEALDLRRKAALAFALMPSGPRNQPARSSSAFAFAGSYGVVPRSA